MKIYDISQEVFGCRVFPGNPTPEKRVLLSMERGERCNLSAFSMCAHNGTHVDAPLHFYNDGLAIDGIPLESVVGEAYVAEHSGVLSGADAEAILKKAKAQSEGSAKRILIKGKATVSLEAARVFSSSKVLLVGNESQTVGPEEAPKAVHLELLGANVVLLEGIRLADVPDGVYLLNAAPLNLAGTEGAPCRAILIDTKI